MARKFRPDKIILFGSFAYGMPKVDSDVDPSCRRGARAVRLNKIRLALSAPFAMDLIVRIPKTLKWRLEEGDSFLREIVSKGKVLYEKVNDREARWFQKWSVFGNREPPTRVGGGGGGFLRKYSMDKELRTAESTANWRGLGGGFVIQRLNQKLDDCK